MGNISKLKFLAWDGTLKVILDNVGFRVLLYLSNPFPSLPERSENKEFSYRADSDSLIAWLDILRQEGIG